MPEIVFVDSFQDFNIIQQSELTSDVSIAGTTLNIKNGNGFDTDHVILIGEAGAEGSEIRIPSDVSGKVITIDALTQDHKSGRKVYVLRANKARVYSAPNVNGTRPTTDTYSLLSPVTHIGDKLEVEYNDTVGGSDFWYLYTFYNDIPTTPVESSKILTDAIRGGNFGNYASPDQVRTEAGLDGNRWIKDSLIYEKLVSAEDEVNASLLIANYTLPLSVIPPKVSHATILLAAGYLLTTDYGAEHSGTNKDGEHKIAQARVILKEIEEGKGRLTDETGTIIQTGSKMAGWPNSTTKSADPKQPKVFSMSDVF